MDADIIRFGSLELDRVAYQLRHDGAQDADELRRLVGEEGPELAAGCYRNCKVFFLSSGRRPS